MGDMVVVIRKSGMSMAGCRRTNTYLLYVGAALPPLTKVAHTYLLYEHEGASLSRILYASGLARDMVAEE